MIGLGGTWWERKMRKWSKLGWDGMRWMGWSEVGLVGRDGLGHWRAILDICQCRCKGSKVQKLIISLV